MRIKPVGDRSLVVDLDGLREVHGLWGSLRAKPPAGAEEVVAGASSVLVTLRTDTDVPAAIEWIRSSRRDGSDLGRSNLVEIPMVYGGPDTEEVCNLTGLSPAALAGRHSESEYSVAFLGFSPGFGYLVGGDPQLRVPRLGTPRPAVPAGSVALAADFTAVYPQPTPGGWRIIGRTDRGMFDPLRIQPSLLSPGDSVLFVPTTNLGPAPAWGYSPLPPVTGDYVLVVDPGPLTTIQDGGRPGWAHLGVPRAGAADRRSASAANQLVGNHPTEAILESTLNGPSLRIGSDRLVAVTGARAPISVDGIPARPDAALSLRAGSEIRVGIAQAGARVYVALSGGLAVDPVMGSRSTDTLSRIGPPPLKAGDVLPLGVPSGAGAHESSGTRPSKPGELITITAQRGPRDDWIGDDGMDALAGSVFEVAATSDRAGVRLSGAAVDVKRREELPSEGMVAGAVQVPPGGDPIVLLRNHPTTGGYPVAAVVTDEGIDALAQAPPGVRVRFELR